MKVGSLFSGIGGLDLAIESLGFKVAWFCEKDNHAASVLERHWPGVPNLRDVSSLFSPTQVEWGFLENSVDALCGGFPCQDISTAGKGAGIHEGTRSGLWFAFARAIRVLRPRYVFVENVSALLTRGLDIVLGDLAALGYDTEWASIRASSIGAPHRRERVFVVAHSIGDEPIEWPSEPEWARQERRVPATDIEDAASTNATVARQGNSRGLHRGGRGWDDAGRSLRSSASVREVVTNASGLRCQTPEQELHGGQPDIAWGDYEPAIKRWERTLGRLAPDPLASQRISPAFVEWMMGLPEGWVSNLGHTAALTTLGNAVVPQQAFRAFTSLLNRLEIAA